MRLIKPMKRILLPILILILTLPLLSYETGKNPKKAALYSFVIPGGGQYYNESIWKTALWSGAEVGFIALSTYHHTKFNDYKDKRDKATNDADWKHWNSEASDQLSKRNNGFWWLGSTVILSVIDAYVDAAMFNYDEEKEALELQFSYNYVGLQFKF